LLTYFGTIAAAACFRPAEPRRGQPVSLTPDQRVSNRMDRSRKDALRARRTRRQRIHDALGYLALLVVIALLVHRHTSLFSPTPEARLAIVGKVASDPPEPGR